MGEQTTFISALKEKYCSEDEALECKTFGVQIVVFGRAARQRGRSRGDSAGEPGEHEGGDGGEESPELEYLKTAVLCDQGISQAAIPSNGLSSLCPNISDLDLSGNALSSWEEVFTIFKHLPRLKFCNLSSNPLRGRQICDKLDFSCGVDDLVLNNTKVTWSEVVALSRLLPNLKQLHLCMNEYNGIPFTEEELAAHFTELHKLALNNNQIRRWEEVAKLRSLPKLKTLILLENPLEDVYYEETSSASLNRNASEEETEKRSGTDPTHSHGDGRSTGSGEESQPVPEGSGQEATGGDAVRDEPGYMDSEEMVKEKEARVKGDSCSVSGKQNKTGESEEIQTDVSAQEEQMRRNPRNDKEQVFSQGFTSLESLCVTDTALSSWQHLHDLRLFPRLHSVKIKNIPLLKSLDQKERRKLAVASLPRIKLLNGSEVTEVEREKSERHFIRTFSGHDDPPARYHELVQTHGKLKPFSHISLGEGFQEFVKLNFIYEGKCIKEDVKMRVIDPVKILRIYCSRLIEMPARLVVLYHKTTSPQSDEVITQELNLIGMPMSRFDMKDGDEIHIDVHVPYVQYVPECQINKSLTPSPR
ncbi:tubulin-specific chaperone cofactor E-like protein [Asterias rubens]|uniref:tubulin-specific chaperone cofactor E-like protein n=1 Tax=Asterias rubens TaxID=7604 RepID=UPI0014550AF3|nr:tubulin-specific chaperone cofactor E-like protein [Asterias rubens]